MKKLNTWTSIIILLSALLYATFIFGQEEPEIRNPDSAESSGYCGFGDYDLLLS